MRTRKPILAMLTAFGLGPVALWPATAAAEKPHGDEHGSAHSKGEDKKSHDEGKPKNEKHADEKPGERHEGDDEKARHEGEGKPEDKGMGHGKGEGEPEDLEKLGLKAEKKEERFDALRKRIEERKRTRDERRNMERANARSRWGELATRPEVREELRLHAMRVARLSRIRELASVDGKAALEERATRALERENARHERRMAAFTSGAPTPAPSASTGGAQ